MIPEAAPLVVQIGIGAITGAIGGASAAASDYNQEHQDLATWNNDDLINTTTDGAIIGGVTGGVSGPRLAGLLTKELQQSDEVLTDGAGI